ncbi:PREDICTED: putative two-component response regulator ARR21 [Lupinus angustifolius]|uniref:putative two-component response regulator ARR21 n=1 Tax=Lupinus angustifolius TaxID=3871 RepID=UPI00092EBCC8|nr:PREDICTED: putative two-component response regulator ARR21 [Lupinus angustifolius]
MTFEKVTFTVLVVDDNDTSLTIVANMLSSWDYKVLTANSSDNALKTLREFEGFFDLVITRVHMSGMNGYEFQQRVKEEFHIPVIMMSTDSMKKEVMTKSEENEAALCLLKPICADDLKEIRKYALAARKGKVVIENESNSSEGESSQAEKSSIEDVKPCAPSTMTHGTKRKKRYTKTKSSGMFNENQGAENRRVQKKPKIVWTTQLHNLFMTAIKQLGYDKAVPKKILEVMNVPYLTRGNIASHLQKYRIFLRNIAERGLVEGLSGKILKSNFASGLTLSVIKDIQTRSEKLRVPVQQYLQNMAHQAENRSTSNASVPFNQGQISPLNLPVQRNAYLTTEHGRDQFSFPMYKGPIHQNQQAFNGYNSLNPGIHGQSSFGNNIVNTGPNEMQQKMLGSNANPNPVYNSGPSNFPLYGIGHGLMTSTSGLTRSLSQNYGSSFGNQSFQYGLGNGNMASLSNSNVPWNKSNCYPPRNNSYGIQQNGGSEMVGTGVKGGFNVGAKNYRSGLVMNETKSGNMHMARAVPPLGNNNNSFGLVNGTQNANMHVAPLGHNNISIDMVNSTQHANGVGNEHHYNGSSITEGDVSRLEDDISELFMMVHNTDLLNEVQDTSY